MRCPILQYLSFAKQLYGWAKNSLTFVSLFSLILYLIRSNENNKHYFFNNGGRKKI